MDGDCHGVRTMGMVLRRYTVKGCKEVTTEGAGA